MFDLHESRNLFIADRTASGFSASTIDQYNRVIDAYARFCILSLDRADPSLPSSVAAYKSWLVTERKVKFSTVQYHLTVLRTLFDFCVRTLRNIDDNPVHEDMNVNRKKLAAEHKPYGDKLMTEQEIKALIHADRPKGSRDRTLLRNRAIVLLLVLSGLRNSELRALTPSDLTFGDDGQITVVNGKGGKRRHVAFPRIAQDAVREYLASGFRPSGLPDTALLFGVGSTNETWHEIDRFSLSTLVKRYVANATGHAGERSHALRHAYASTLLTNDMPIQIIQQQLGHSSIRTTERYASMLAPQKANQRVSELLNSIF